MRNTLLIAFFLLSNFFFCSLSHAQLGWQWGITSHEIGNGGIDPFNTVIDNAGSVFVLCENISDTSSFSAIHVYNPHQLVQLILVKADSAGNFLWACNSQNSDVTPLSLAVDIFGNAYILADYDSATCLIDTVSITSPSGRGGWFLAKVAPSGHVLWATNVPRASCLSVDSYGNPFIIGGFYSTLTLGSSTLVDTGTGTMAFIAKFDPFGNPLWAQSYGQGNCDVYASAMVMTGNNSIYVTGLYNRPMYYPSGYISIGSTTLSATVTRLGTMGNYLAKFDSSGNSIWAEKLNDHEGVRDIATDQAGNIFLTGTVDSTLIFGADTLICAGLSRILVAKYDSAGNAVWGRSAGNSVTNNSANNIVVDACGKLWIWGNLTSADTINFNGHYLTCPPASVDPVYLAEYDTSGNYLNSLALPSSGDDFLPVAVDNRGNLYVTGDYFGVVTMVFGHDTLSTIDSSIELLLIAKYKYDTTNECGIALHVQQTVALPNNITLFPNPATSDCTIHSSTPFPPNSKAEFYDLTGRLIHTRALAGSNTVISVSGLAPGMYQCRITSGDNNVVVKKLVVMK